MERSVADVLVIAADSNIESLVGELVAFAGHRPVYDVTVGAAGESVRRARPHIALVDTALPLPVVQACFAAAAESGTRVVLMSSNASQAELARHAAAERSLYFMLPGGPTQLREVLDRALALERPLDMPLPALRRSRHHVPGSVHPALCAALATVARARLLVLRAQLVRRNAVLLREINHDVLAETQRSRAVLRAAVTDFATQLKAARMSEADAIEVVRDTISDCAGVIGAGTEMEEIFAESSDWTRAVYRAA